jgi:hypothetical protein
MYFLNHYQNAYVTRDIDKGISFMETRYGVHGLAPIDLELDVVTPQGRDKVVMRLAVAWVGKLNVELIQPVSGCIDHYVDSLPVDNDDFSPRFNHIAMRRDDFDAMRSEITCLNLPILFEGSFDGLRYIYVDARKELGHLLEYVWATPEVWDFLGWPQ